MESPKNILIGFWKKESGNLFAHKEGLSPEQAGVLQTIRPGTRFALLANKNRKSANSPDYLLKIWEDRPEGSSNE